MASLIENKNTVNYESYAHFSLYKFIYDLFLKNIHESQSIIIHKKQIKLFTILANFIFQIDSFIYEYLTQFCINIILFNNVILFDISINADDCCVCTINARIENNNLTNFHELSEISIKMGKNISYKTTCFNPPKISSNAGHTMTDLLQMLKTHILIFFRHIIVNLPILINGNKSSSVYNIAPLKLFDCALKRIYEPNYIPSIKNKDNESTRISNLLAEPNKTPYIKLSNYKVVRGKMPLYHKYGYKPSTFRQKIINKVHKYTIKNLKNFKNKNINNIMSNIYPVYPNNTPLREIAEKHWNSITNAKQLISERIVSKAKTSVIANKNYRKSHNNNYNFLNTCSKEWIQMNLRFKLIDAQIISFTNKDGK